MTNQMTHNQAREIAQTINDSLTSTFESQPAISVQGFNATIIVNLYLKNSDIANVTARIDLARHGDYRFQAELTGYSFNFEGEHVAIALDLASLIQQAHTAIALAQSVYNDQVAKLILNS